MNYAKARTFNTARTLSPAAHHALRSAIGRDVTAWTDCDLDAVAAWQAKNNLTPDGMIGAKSLAVLMTPAEAQRIVPNFIHEAAEKFPGWSFGFDVSKWQPDLDPTKMQGCSFAILKATQSRTQDPLFEDHCRTLAGVMPRGNYHLPHMASGEWGAVTVAEVERQAKFAGGVAKKYPAAFYEWLDFEPDREDKEPLFFEALLLAVKGNRAKAAAWVKRWRDVFEDCAGVPCGSYISPKIAGLGGEELRAVLMDRPLWIACYIQQPKLPVVMVPKMPESWGDRWDMWQMRGSDDKKTTHIDEGGKCLGVMGGRKDCDQNVLNPASALVRLLAA